MNHRMPDDFQVPDDPDAGRLDAAYLRSCLGLRAKPGEEPPPLPASVRRGYYDMARSLSILGSMGRGMTPTQLATVVVVALREGVVPQDDEPAYSFLSAQVEPGQKVVIRWRNKDRPAHFLELRDDRVVVLHDGDERSIRPDLVRFPDEGEFAEVAENINRQPVAKKLP